MGQGIPPKIGNGLKEMAMGKDMVPEKRKGHKSYRPNGTQSQTYYTIQEPRKNGKYLPMKGTGNGQDGQLSQVVPGGGVLKIKLSKKKPIKITAEAPDGEPDPAQKLKLSMIL